MRYKHFNFIWAIACYVLLAQTAIADDENKRQKDSSPSAEDRVMQYFSALEQGDTTDIRKLLGGALLKSRVRLLSNPTYPATLQEIYRDSDFSIITSNILDNNRAEVEAEVTLNDSRQLRFRFQLERNNGQANDNYSDNDDSDDDGKFLIYAEEEILPNQMDLY